MRYNQKLWIDKNQENGASLGYHTPTTAKGRRKDTPCTRLPQIAEITQSLDELAREGARRMIQAALELEVDWHIQDTRHLRTINAIESAFLDNISDTRQRLD